MPRALIFAPQRRSMVSSMPITTGPCGTKRASRRANICRANARLDQRFRLSTRWKVLKSGASRRPMMLSAAVTVRRPGVRMAPLIRTSTCCQVGRVKWMANAAIHWARLLGPREGDMRAAHVGDTLGQPGWELCGKLGDDGLRRAAYRGG